MKLVSRETREALDTFKSMVLAQNEHQNLISRSTVADFDERHIRDALQLAELGQHGSWCDIGSGAGLPGVVIALVTRQPMTLIEPRKLRAEFLRRVVDTLRLDAEVVESKAERVTGTYANITARALASLPRLLPMTAHLARSDTRWILPKGRNAKKELADAQQSWQGDFRLVQSQTDTEAMIVLAQGVRRRGAR